MSAVTLSMLIAFTAACGFALGNAIQHRAAGSVDLDRGLLQMTIRLFRSPQWLVGSALALTAFGLHITAMNLGSVAIVQPFLVGAVVVAVPIRAFLDRQMPTRSELGWVAFTVVGIVVFVSVANAERSSGTPHDGRAAIAVVLGFVGASLWASTAPRFNRPTTRAFVLASASGVVFGVTAGLMKFVRHDAADGLAGFLLGWHFWALLIGSVLGTLLNQRSYQAAALSASMPAMNTIDIIVAVTFGWVVFGEPPAHSATSLGVQVVCLLATGFGLFQIAREEDVALHHDDAIRPEPSESRGAL